MICVQEDENQGALSQGDYEDLLDSVNQIGVYFGPYLKQEPDSRLMGLLASADLNGVESYFKPGILYYRALPNRLPITILVLAFAQRSLEPTSAALQKYEPILQFFLEKGARPNAKDTLGQTALHYSVMMNPFPPLAELLLEHGADPNAQTRSGYGPMMNAVQGAHVRPPVFTWHIATLAAVQEERFLHLSDVVPYRELCQNAPDDSHSNATRDVHITGRVKVIAP